MKPTICYSSQHVNRFGTWRTQFTSEELKSEELKSEELTSEELTSEELTRAHENGVEGRDGHSILQRSPSPDAGSPGQGPS